MSKTEHRRASRDGANDPERQRLEEAARRERNWQRWGPYLSERQWGTVREDDTVEGHFWRSFPYEQARSRAYRWGEDGLLGLTDRECRLCFAVALWNGQDDHLKERLFGLTNPEGNHGEDVKEAYFYLDATPTHSYLRALYKYPQRPFPYERLREESRRRGRDQGEFELADTDAFDDDRYWDVTVEYAKAGPDDILVRLTVANRGPERARLWVVPQLWFRNTWRWGSASDEGRWARPSLRPDGPDAVVAEHETLGKFHMFAEAAPGARWWFTDNETNPAAAARPPAGAHGGGGGEQPPACEPRAEGGAGEARDGACQQGDGPGLGGGARGREGQPPEPPPARFFKDAIHALVVGGERGAVNGEGGTKAARVVELELGPGEERVVCLRLTAAGERGPDPLGEGFGRVFAARRAEADRFYDGVLGEGRSPAERAIARQAYAGLLWSEQFYHYVVPDWLEGDPRRPLPEREQRRRRNHGWRHLFSRDVLNVPDKWEYPAFFSWDSAFQMIPLARVDPAFAKHQLLLLLREWYLDPSGQLPSSEYALEDVFPPVHAWACWQVFRRTGGDDFLFLERAFHKLLMNFTWWVNRKDPQGRGVFAGGVLGMDNIGVFDRSQPLPGGAALQQADGTAWMGFYCATMLKIAIELAMHDPAYEDTASKFLEHFVVIADAINHLGGAGLWDDDDGFYYDQLVDDEERTTPLKVRSMIGMIPLLAVYILDERVNRKLPSFFQRLRWFMTHRGSRMPYIEGIEQQGEPGEQRALLALPTRERLERALGYLLDEGEFLSPFGVRSLSRFYRDHPYEFRADGEEQPRVVRYWPGDMESADFGGNSNWRGPVWFPVNYLLIEALGEYHSFFGDALRVECPRGSGQQMTLGEVASELSRRLTSLFLPQDGRPRPCHGSLERFADDPHWRDHLLFHEYFDGDSGRGLGASHQTGWTALIACLLEEAAPPTPPLQSTEHSSDLRIKALFALS